MSDVEALNLAPEEAIAHFRSKGLLTSFSWQDVDAAEHLKSFTVAKGMKIDILNKIRGDIDKALVDGWSMQRFQKELAPKLKSAGWWGVKEMTDPLTGEIRPVRLGSPSRLKIIYDTNIRMAHSYGRWQRIERLKEFRPFLRYIATLDDRVRPLHRRMDNTILPVDDEFWNTWYPPNGWRCRCTVQQLSGDDLEDMDLEPNDEAPEIIDRTWINRRTGEILEIPRGIDPGFDHNVGKLDQLSNVQKIVDDKILHSPTGAADDADDLLDEAMGIMEQLRAQARKAMQEEGVENFPKPPVTPPPKPARSPKREIPKEPAVAAKQLDDIENIPKETVEVAEKISKAAKDFKVDDYIAEGRKIREEIISDISAPAGSLDESLEFREKLVADMKSKRGAGSVKADLKGNPEYVREVSEKLDVLPASWIKATNKDDLYITRKRKGAGGGRHGRLSDPEKWVDPGEIDLSKTYYYMDYDHRVGTPFHEYLHHVQTHNRKLDNYFVDIHRRRTKRQKTTQVGWAGKNADRAYGRKDKYLDSYAGREYGIAEEPLEVMTVHLETLFYNSNANSVYHLLDKDPEMLDLMLGLLYRYDP